MPFTWGGALQMPKLARCERYHLYQSVKTHAIQHDRYRRVLRMKAR
jgi:hypothetical protein